MAFDSDATFALEIHIIQHLGFHVFGSNRTGIFEKSVGKSGLAVVYVRYYAEVAYMVHKLFVIAAIGCANLQKNRVMGNKARVAAKCYGKTVQ